MGRGSEIQLQVAENLNKLTLIPDEKIITILYKLLSNILYLIKVLFNSQNVLFSYTYFSAL